MSIRFERFTDVYQFMSTLKTRNNNPLMETQNASHKVGGWSGTNTYEDAEKDFKTGYPDKVAAMKEIFSKLSLDSSTPRNKPTVKRYYYGYAPNVPAAIAGYPKSMYKRTINKIPMKAVSILYAAGASCFTPEKDLEKAGYTIFKLVNWFELNGYRVELNLIPFTGESRRDDIALCALRLKNYGDRLDLLKLSFPITSPAMFRRFGFRWLETVPDLPGKSDDWQGYGCTLDRCELIETLKQCDKSINTGYVFNFYDVESAHFDHKKLFDNIEQYKFK